MKTNNYNYFNWYNDIFNLIFCYTLLHVFWYKNTDFLNKFSFILDFDVIFNLILDSTIIFLDHIIWIINLWNGVLVIQSIEKHVKKHVVSTKIYRFIRPLIHVFLSQSTVRYRTLKFNCLLLLFQLILLCTG